MKWLQGTWVVSKAEAAGLPESNEHLNKKMVIDGNTMTTEGKGKARIEIRVDRYPKEIDMIALDEPGLPPAPGIYRMDGDKLVLCLSGHTRVRVGAGQPKQEMKLGKRPTKFAGTDESLLLTLVREEK